MKKMRFLLAVLTMFLMTSCKYDTFEPAQKMILQENGYFTSDFWVFFVLSLIWGLILAFEEEGLGNIYIEGYVKAKKERDKIFMPRDRRSKEEKKRLRLYSMPFFAVSLFFFVAFVIGFLKPETIMFGDYHAILSISLAIMMFSIGVQVVRWRLSYYDKKGKILRVLTTIFYLWCYTLLFYSFIIGIVYDSDEISCLRLVFLVSGIISMIAFAITKNKLKKCEVIKPEDGDEK